LITTFDHVTAVLIFQMSLFILAVALFSSF